MGVAYSLYKNALRTKLRNLILKYKFSIFDSFRDIRVHKGGLTNLILGKSLGIDKNNTFQLKFLF